MPNNIMKDYLTTEKSLANDNYELIEKAEYSKDSNVDGD
jgi:hypothetical protein